MSGYYYYYYYYYHNHYYHYYACNIYVVIQFYPWLKFVFG